MLIVESVNRSCSWLKAIAFWPPDLQPRAAVSSAVFEAMSAFRRCPTRDYDKLIIDKWCISRVLPVQNVTLIENGQYIDSQNVRRVHELGTHRDRMVESARSIVCRRLKRNMKVKSWSIRNVSTMLKYTYSANSHLCCLNAILLVVCKWQFYWIVDLRHIWLVLALRQASSVNIGDSWSGLGISIFASRAVDSRKTCSYKWQIIYSNDIRRFLKIPIRTPLLGFVVLRIRPAGELDLLERSLTNSSC